jgi:hypothetical protein
VDEEDVRAHAEAFGAALVAGDVEHAIEGLSAELRQNLGEVLTLLPLPSTATSIESIEHGAAGYIVVMRLVGESEEILLQTRWRDRDGRPTIVEASHLSRTELAVADEDVAPDGALDAAERDRPV